MKTSVNMVRKLDVFDVIQRTKDGMFDANALLRQWNQEKNDNLKMSKFFESEKVQEFISALEEDLKTQVSDTHQGEKSYLGDYQVVKEIKGKRDKTGLKAPDQVWMHPILFIKFAMWLNPRFEVKVIKFVYDNLIAFRHSCGDNYRSLTASVSKFPDVDYSRLARALNYVVFGKHYPGIRKDATEEELSNLKSLEEKYVFALDKGYIPTFKALISSLHKDWETKWRNNK